MCYTVHLSTTLAVDLAAYDRDALFFERIDDADASQHLQYPHRYHIATGARGCCSCHLRIFDEALAADFTWQYFERQDWLDECEHDDNIINTAHLYDVIANIVRLGHRIDTFSARHDNDGEQPCLHRSTVTISDVDKETFALFQGNHVDYV